MVKNGKGLYVLAGIVSYGDECGPENQPPGPYFYFDNEHINRTKKKF